MTKNSFKNIKVENEEVLSKIGYPYFDFLPELKRNIKIRPIYEIKIRAFILSVLVQTSFDIITQKQALYYLENAKLQEHLTAKEISYLNYGKREDKINETWKSECIWTLLWCLSIINEIGSPSELAELNTIEAKYYPFINLKSSPDNFLNNSDFEIRETTQITKMLDLYSRLDYIGDWSSINDINPTFNTAVVYERRYTLEWATSNTAWDNIKCISIL